MTSEPREISPQKSLTLKISSTAIFTAMGLVLSYANPFVYLPINGVIPNPFVHMLNAITGVLLGPWYSLLSAFLLAILRNYLGIGTILAFPGGMSGAIIVGLVREIILKFKPKHVLFAALTEPIGTIFIGATISSLIKSLPIPYLMGVFAFPCIAGCILGYITLQIMQKYGMVSNYIPVPTKILNQTAVNIT